MNSISKTCKKCSADFIIEPDDISFYEKMGVFHPDMCPLCRAQLRLSFRNERVFYKRNCDKYQKSVVSMYSPNKPDTVWCYECWFADDWSGADFAKEYDDSRPFFEQLEELWKVVPKVSLVYIRSPGSEYINISADNKNCYMIVESSNNEDCTHCYWIQLSTDLVDCSFTNKVERSYESDDCYDSYGLLYSKGCYSCTDSYFLTDSRGCTDCIGCINLRNKSHHIFNQAYSKEEYEKIKKELQLDTYSGVQAFRKKYDEFMAGIPRKFAKITQGVNSTGNYLSNVKNVTNCFHTYEAEDCKYCVHAWRTAKDNMDCDTVGRVSVNNYQCVNSGQEASNNMMSSLVWTTSFATYSWHCLGSQSLFGCVGLRQQKYCILNKQYSKEEYEAVTFKIINKLKETGEYGQFFPAYISCFGYNEACVQEQFPLTKEEALDQGFKWEDTPRGTYGKETKKWDEVPDSIHDTQFDVAKEIFVCEKCEKNYKIIENEFLFYKKLSIPLPHMCPDCRHNRRFIARGPNKLWHRACMNAGCNNEFETSYAPERSEIIYCESCYQKEVM